MYLLCFFIADTYYNLFIHICILLDMLVDATVRQYLSSNLPYCMIFIHNIQIVGALVLYWKIHSHKKYGEFLRQWRGHYLSAGGENVPQSC